MPKTTSTRPMVATTSPRSCPPPARSWVETETASRSNIRLATITPSTPPTTCAATSAAAVAVVITPNRLSEGDDRVERCGDRLERQDEGDQYCAGGDAVFEELQPDVVGESRSAAMPEPTTAATRKAVPTSSAGAARRASAHAVTPPSSEARSPSACAVDSVVDPDPALLPVQQA